MRRVFAIVLPLRQRFRFHTRLLLLLLRVTRARRYYADAVMSIADYYVVVATLRRVVVAALRDIIYCYIARLIHAAYDAATLPYPAAISCCLPIDFFLRHAMPLPPRRHYFSYATLFIISFCRRLRRHDTPFSPLLSLPFRHFSPLIIAASPLFDVSSRLFSPPLRAAASFIISCLFFMPLF